MPTSSQCRVEDTRRAPRISIYLAATLFCDGVSSPVRIRNISTSGALLEGAVVPGEGTLVQLIRGQLIAHGLVAWSEGGRCGLKFSGKVDVERWRCISTNVEQERVDEVVRLVKAGAVPLPVPQLGALNVATAVDPAGALSGDLRRVYHLLDKLGNALAAESEILMKHGETLQGIDISMQLVAALAAVVGKDNHGDCAALKLETLRNSADQALLQRA